MKVRIFLALFLSMGLISACGAEESEKNQKEEITKVATEPTDIVYIPDKVLKEVINDDLLDQEPTEDITLEQMQSITGETFIQVVGRGGEISDLTGIEYLKNVDDLRLYIEVDNVDLSPLKKLTSLSSLHINGESKNEIDLTPIWVLTQLQELYVSDFTLTTPIENIAQLSQLKSVDFGNNNYEDYTPLFKISTLEKLYVSDSLVTEEQLLLLNELTSLGALGLSNVGLSNENLEEITQLTQLETLVIDNNQLTDIRKIGRLSNLGILNIGSNQIANIDSLAYLFDLEQLYASGNQISDVEPLKTLTSLQALDLRTNNISNWQRLEGRFPELLYIYSKGNPVEMDLDFFVN